MIGYTTPQLAIMLGQIGGYSLAQIVKWVIIAIILVGVLLVVLRTCEVTIPAWAWKIAGLVLLGIVALIAINLLLSFA